MVTRVGPPEPVGASIWDGFVPGGDPTSTPVAVGGDLTPTTLIGAYRRGLFPWPPNDPAIVAILDTQFGAAVRTGEIPNLTPERPPTLEIPWWSPEPRGALAVDAPHVSHSLRKRFRSCGWATTLNRRFAEVMDRCRRGDENSWISPRLRAAYQRLHQMGWAHSIEVWAGEELVGGVYGVLVGGVFTGESMFHTRTDASKVGLIDLAARLAECGGLLIDTQFISDHLRTLGAQKMHRAEFIKTVAETADQVVRPISDRLPVDRLVY